MNMTATTEPTTTTSTHGGRLVATDGRELPLASVHLACVAGGGIARAVLTQTFENPFDEPLTVRYLLPLPSDGAVSGFSFLLGDQRVVGEVTGKQAARERFERALVQGRTAALLEQERSSLFTQRVGNVPPRTTVVAEITVDQPLRWLEEGCWEWRFPTTVGPRYLGAPGKVADAAAISVPVASHGVGVRATLSLDLEDGLTGPVESPSHPIQSCTAGTVAFEGQGAVRLDRDVVVRWPVALPSVSANVIAARPATAAHDGHAFALVTVAPPTSGGVAVPRDLTFLIDTSGSMGGRPLEQAQRVVLAMIDTLGVQDRLELIEFGSRPRRWRDQPALATEANKEAARAWVVALVSSGGTEMHRAVLEALRPLRPDSQRQVVLVTDGFIGFEREIVKTLLDELPQGARLHTVGVGSSVNRSLTQAAARAGRGTELIVGLGEDADRLAHRLVARTTAPLVTDLTLEGPGVLEVAPRRLPDLYAEAPALITARLALAGGEVVLRGRTAEGPWEQRLRVPARGVGEGPRAVAALFAREKVEDLETTLTAGATKAEVDRAIEDTGVEFQISTRLTSWVAVSKQVTVKQPAREVEQPHELPHGVSAEGLGLRHAGQVAQTTPTTKARLGAEVKLEAMDQARTISQKDAESIVRRITTKRILPPEPTEEQKPAEKTIEDVSHDTKLDLGLLGRAFKSALSRTEEAPAPVDRDERSRTGEQASVEEEPVVEVPSVSAAQGESDAALLESGEELQSEAFELMDEDDGLQDRVAGGGRGGPLTADGSLPAGRARAPKRQVEPAPDLTPEEARELLEQQARRDSMSLTRTGSVLPPLRTKDGRWVSPMEVARAASRPTKAERTRARSWRLLLAALVLLGLLLLALSKAFGAPSSAPGGASTEGSPAAPGLGGPR